VERIHFTFVQLRHWSGNRLVVPVSKFVSEMFENRSLETTDMKRFVNIHLSHEMDMEKVRSAFETIVQEKESVDEDEAAIRVVGHDATGMIAMCELPIPNIEDGWQAECEVREELLAAVRKIGQDSQIQPFPAAVAAA
jgi:small-conductance mechanosensitive channel